MIGRLTGKLLEKQAPYLLIDVAGVGYEVQAPMTSFYPLPALGEPVLLHTHLSVSENAHQLFAFYTLEERLLFRTLIKVSGVGPKMALAILSGMPVNEFVQCVQIDDVAALVRVPGVGKKTAERLIIEVKDRLGDLSEGMSRAPIVQPAQTFNENEGVTGDLLADSASAAPSVLPSVVIADAESALIALGYKPAQAAKMISAAQKVEPVTTSEALIRLSLKSVHQ
ncbi:Holliday junction branch migration protein RuvA [Eionea flava]